MTAFSAAAIASSLAGTSAAEQVKKAEEKRAEHTRTKPRPQQTDEVELHQVEAVEAIEGAEATRTIHSNTDEDASEDHRQRAASYTPEGLVANRGKARSIDLRG